MKKKIAALTLAICMTFAFGGCAKEPADTWDPDMNTIQITLTSDPAPLLAPGEEYALVYRVTDVLTKPTATVKATGDRSVGIYNEDLQRFYALGEGSFKLTVTCDQEPHVYKDITITVKQPEVAGETVEPDSRIRFDTTMEEELPDGAEETELWRQSTIYGRFGNEGKVSLNYYQDDKGLYFKATVRDDNLYSAKQGLKGSAAIEDSDRVEFHLDLGKDGGANPQLGDFRIRVDLLGNCDVFQGTGSTWKEAAGFKPDKLSVGLIGGYNASTVTTRSATATGIQASETDRDGGYVVKMFISYSNFGFTKRDAYGLTVGHADYMSIDGAQAFVAAGDTAVPNKFRPLSVYGLGVDYELEAAIDGKTDDAIYASPQAQRFEIKDLPYGGQADKGTVDCTTIVYMGARGMYVAVNTVQEYLKYTYSGHTWQGDHAEIRIDTNGDGVSQNTTTGDLYMHADIMGTILTAFGITDDTRNAGTYNFVSAIGFTGELKSLKGVPVLNIGEKPNTIHMEFFFPYASMSVRPGDTVALMISLGNHDASESQCCVGNVFNVDKKESDFDIYNTYSKYQRFAVPADAVV